MKSFMIMCAQLLFSLAMYAMAVVFFGVALISGIILILKAWHMSALYPLLSRAALLGLSLAGGYFLFGFSLILLVGGAIINAHIVERGRLKLKKVKIGSNVTIGSHSTIMPGCEIGEHAIIGATAVLQKNSKVQPRSVWYGVPAKNIRNKRGNDDEEKS